MKDIKFLKENGVDVDKSIELFGDITIYNETMQDFLDGITSKLERLANAKNVNDLNNYAVFAHSIKSDARYLGFTSVAEIALKHEMAGKESNQKVITEGYEELLQNVDFMVNTVKQYLTEDSDAPIITNNPKKNILVVDDSPLITNLVDKSLKNEYNVIIYNSGTEAKNYIENNSSTIDCLLLDLNMPDITGFEVLEFLKEKQLYNSIKVSIITGDESKETINKAFTYPIKDMLSKPFNLNDLKSVVEKTMM